MSAQLFWLHEEVLSEALIQTHAAEGCRFLFVFDTVWLTQRPVSLKRIQFIYETLVALPIEIEIVYGDAAQVLKQKVLQRPDVRCKVVLAKRPRTCYKARKRGERGWGRGVGKTTLVRAASE